MVRRTRAQRRDMYLAAEVAPVVRIVEMLVQFPESVEVLIAALAVCVARALDVVLDKGLL